MQPLNPGISKPPLNTNAVGQDGMFEYPWQAWFSNLASNNLSGSQGHTGLQGPAGVAGIAGVGPQGACRQGWSRWNNWTIRKHRPSRPNRSNSKYKFPRRKPLSGLRCHPRITL